MSQRGERCLFESLIDPEYLSEIALAGLPSEVIPSEDLRPIYEFALRYFQRSGARSAPTVAVFRNTEVEGEGRQGVMMADVLAEHEIFFDSFPDETVDWILEDLRSGYISRILGEWTKATITEVTQATPADRHRKLSERATELVGISMDLEEGRTRVNLADEGPAILADYDERHENEDSFIGMRLGFNSDPDDEGFSQIDLHTNGIRDGELAILGAGPKTGKSFALAHTALTEFQHGRNVAFYTLENSIEMTKNRIACLATRVNSHRFERGECLPAERAAVEAWVNDILPSRDNKLWIISPEDGHRRPENIVLEAQTLNVDSLIIDQLTFIEAPDTRLQRYLQIREICHSIKTMISTGRKRIPCLMAHQISRDGVKNARKNGYHWPEDMAEGSEVERTADWVFALYQSHDARIVNQVLCQLMAARRADTKAWELSWDIENAALFVVGETELPS